MKNRLTDISKEIAGTPLLRNILILVLLIVLAYPIYFQLYIFPSFSKLLIAITEKDAIKAADHISSSLLKNREVISKEQITDEFKSEISLFQKTIMLEKVKLFSKSGEIIYSTDSSDIGTVNQHNYFFETVSKGGVYTKFVQKGTPSLEGRIVVANVVETYVPIMINGEFVGAFEIYYEISDKLEAFNSLVSGILFLSTIGATALLFVFLVVIIKATLVLIKNRKAEEKLQTSEKQYRELVESTNTIVLRTDENLRIMFLNRFGLEFFGYTTEEIIGASLMGTIVPQIENDGRDLSILMEEIVNHPEIHRDNENENIRKNGERVWVAWRNQPIYNAQGKAIELLCTGYDITLRKKADLKIREQNEKLEAANQHIQFELEQAKIAQLALLPTKIPDFPGLDLAIKYYPMAQIGGDFYDFNGDGNKKIGILVGDVTGHGIPAALLSFLFMNTFRNIHDAALAPDVLLQLSNTILVNKLPEAKYATMFYCVYDIPSRVLSYASAGHPAAMLLHQGSEQVVHLQTSGMMVGMFENPISPYETKTVTLSPGDKVLIYTDGILEVTDVNDRMLEPDELETFLLTHSQQPIDQLLENVNAFCLNYSGQQGIKDDVTMIGFEVLE